MESRLAGVVSIEPELHTDARGFFARIFCRDEFRRLGLPADIAQENLSYNERKGTLRGLHYQAEPGGEAKLVRCIRGVIHDVVVDLRRASATFGQWESFRLDDVNRRSLFIPAGCAHGFQTLADATELHYAMSAPYAPHLDLGVRWNDPDLGIAWPLADPILSEADRALPTFREAFGADVRS